MLQSIFFHILCLPFCGRSIWVVKGGREGREVELEDYIHRRSIIWEGDTPLTLLLTRPFLCPNITYSPFLVLSLLFSGLYILAWIILAISHVGKYTPNKQYKGLPPKG